MTQATTRLLKKMITDDPTGDTLSSLDNQPTTPASDNSLSASDATPQGSETRQLADNGVAADPFAADLDEPLAAARGDTPLDVRQFFADPDAVGTTAYRTVFDMLEELADCAGSQYEPFTRGDALIELDNLSDVITSMRARLSSGLSEPAFNFGSSSPDDLRAAGLRVQLHQDACGGESLNGPSTEWTFINMHSVSETFVGRTDAEALDRFRQHLCTGNKFTVTTPDGIREHYLGTNVGDVALKVLRNEGGDVTPGWLGGGLPQAPGFKIGDNVIISPKAGHPAFEFAGTIVGRRPTGDWIVEDQAGDAFDCSADQMRHETETD